MITKKFMISILIFLFTITGVTFAMDWPLPEAQIIQNFGSNDQGTPVLGTMLEGEGMVLTADSGELIFSSSGNETASRLPSPLGAWSAVAHSDGLVSIYSRYRDEGRTRQQAGHKPGYTPGHTPWQLEPGSPIAQAGVSGWSRNNGVYFILYDRRERRWVNSLMVIMLSVDTASPQILGMQLKNANGKLLDSSQIKNLSQGRNSIVVNAVDALLETGGAQLAPHRIVCSVNGEEIGSVSFDTISAKDGVIMVNRNGMIPAKRVYSLYPAFEIGEVQLNRGQAILEIVVHDIAGNTRSSITRIIVD